MLRECREMWLSAVRVQRREREASNSEQSRTVANHMQPHAAHEEAKSRIYSVKPRVSFAARERARVVSAKRSSLFNGQTFGRP
jgi:hypothetical protein